MLNIKKAYIGLSGGLGNQMFKYAFARNLQLTQGVKCYLDYSPLKNVGHEKLALDHLDLSKEIEIVDARKLFKKKFINFIGKWYTNPKRLYNTSNKIKMNKKIHFFQPFLNFFGIYFYYNCYYDFKKIKRKTNYFNMDAQSPKYFEKSKDTIIKELRVKDELSSKNKKILSKIEKENSVCVHIRRGDYVNTEYDVCNIEYFLNAVKYMNNKVKNPVYYIFSDDINFVKENINFGKNKVVYVEKNNQFEDLKLMYNCKHFIISNSTFSFWAQYLSLNKDKIVIAPKKWFNGVDEPDIYEDFWIKM